MDDTLPSIDDSDGNDLVLGPVGDDTLFGDYDDEVTVEQIALLNDSVAHLGMDDWPDALPPDTETIIYGGKLWRRVIVGSLVVRIGETPRICIEYEPV